MRTLVGDGTWLTVGEVAQMLGVSDTTVRQYVADGRLDATRLPSGHRRIRRTSAEAMHREIYGDDVAGTPPQMA